VSSSVSLESNQLIQVAAAAAATITTKKKRSKKGKHLHN